MSDAVGRREVDKTPVPVAFCAFAVRVAALSIPGAPDALINIGPHLLNSEAGVPSGDQAWRTSCLHTGERDRKTG